jgi:nucleoside triphosphate diphosphatase
MANLAAKTAPKTPLSDSAPRLIAHADQIDSNPILALRKIMQRLRQPLCGCPWDVKQDFASVAPYTIEEAYEVADAIARGNTVDLQEELGDLLLQVVFHAQIAAEAGLFDFDDVTRGINEKMLRRHPHVFAGATVSDAEEQTQRWEQLKKAEKAARIEAQPGAIASALDSVSRGLPEWPRALKLQKRAAELGFDWPNLTHVLAKLREEVNELEQATQSDDLAHQLEELGDVLFVAANVARHLKLDPAAALRGCNLKFESRFRQMEQLAVARNLLLKQLSLEQQDALWDEAKAIEKAAKRAAKSGQAKQ